VENIILYDVWDSCQLIDTSKTVRTIDCYKENYNDPLAKKIVDEFKDDIKLKAFEGVTSNSIFRYYKSFSQIKY
jgi:hypothetical protein